MTEIRDEECVLHPRRGECDFFTPSHSSKESDVFIVLDSVDVFILVGVHSNRKAEGPLRTSRNDKILVSTGTTFGPPTAPCSALLWLAASSNICFQWRRHLCGIPQASIVASIRSRPLIRPALPGAASEIRAYPRKGPKAFSTTFNP